MTTTWTAIRRASASTRAEWDSASVYSGYTARVAQSGGANMYVNFDDADRLYCVELTYAASSNLSFRQYTNDGYTSLATLVGDGVIRKVVVPLNRDYRDYNGADSNGLINVLFEFSGPLTLIDAAVTGDGISTIPFDRTPRGAERQGAPSRAFVFANGRGAVLQCPSVAFSRLRIHVLEDEMMFARTQIVLMSLVAGLLAGVLWHGPPRRLRRPLRRNRVVITDAAFGAVANDGLDDTCGSSKGY